VSPLTPGTPCLATFIGVLPLGQIVPESDETIFVLLLIQNLYPEFVEFSALEAMVADPKANPKAIREMNDLDFNVIRVIFIPKA
jgi:hypothetical protein